MEVWRFRLLFAANKRKWPVSVCEIPETWRHGHGDMEMETWNIETQTWDMETWRNRDIGTWTWRHGHGDMDIETSTSRHGHRDMDIETWAWRHRHGDIDMKMWTWRHRYGDMSWRYGHVDIEFNIGEFWCFTKKIIRETEAQVVFHDPFTACSSCERNLCVCPLWMRKQTEVIRLQKD